MCFSRQGEENICGSDLVLPSTKWALKRARKGRTRFLLTKE